MQRVNQFSLFEPIPTKDDDWTFNGASTRELTHCYHDYPARMIPQIASKLIDIYGAGSKLLFDPYCGSGTSLVEALLHGIDAIGTDLNPLARMIAEAKISIPELSKLDNAISRYNDFMYRSKVINLEKSPIIKGITNIDFWFKPQVIEKLLRIKIFIDTIEDQTVRLFFKVAFSETIRESSNTRNEEFKLYRYDEKRLKFFNPEVFLIMSAKLRRNKLGLERYVDKICKFKNLPTANVYSFNTVNEIPTDIFDDFPIDIVVTSPPYGDSHTTVAYGQYSRLSAAWLDLEEPDRIDQSLMGGKTLKRMPQIESEKILQSIHLIRQKNEKRALEVAAFYSDLYQSIKNVAKIIKPGGHACYVVGNRKVNGLVLPTDKAIVDFFSSEGYEHITTHERSIPNKRMPLRNSPTNETGKLDDTMTQEYIVVMRKKSLSMVAERHSNYSISSLKNKLKKPIKKTKKTSKSISKRKK